VLKVELQGREHLPRSVTAEHFIEAARVLSRMLGVYGRIILRVRNNETGMFAATDRHHCRYRTVDFYMPNIRGERCAIRDMMAICLAHELIHASQDCRGSSDLPPEVEEHEALALERVYGPVAIDIIKHGKLTRESVKKKGKRK